MRIQDTDRILKESRLARHHVAQQEHSGNVLTRAWKMISRMWK